MELNHQGQRVIITAAATGIGHVYADAFSKSGARVHICDINTEALAQFQQEFPDLGVTLADVSDPAQVDRLFEEAEDHLGGLDVLVNNAGIAGPAGPVEAIDPVEWEHTMAVNINGQFHCVRRAVPVLKASGGGSIVNIASASGLFGYLNRTPYATSKWAVIGFTKTLAMDLGEYGIRVNAICPGIVAGERTDRTVAIKAEAEGISLTEAWGHKLRENSMHTKVTAQEVANMVLFICSKAGAKISGQALSIDGNTETMRT